MPVGEVTEPPGRSIAVSTNKHTDAAILPRQVVNRYGLGVVIVETAIIETSSAITAIAAAIKSTIQLRSSCLPRGRNDDLLAEYSKCPSTGEVLSLDIAQTIISNGLSCRAESTSTPANPKPAFTPAWQIDPT